MLVVFILNQPCRILSGNPTMNCRDCAYLLININEASPWTGNILVVFILNQPCKTADLQTLHICKPFTSRHYKYPSRCTNLKTTSLNSVSKYGRYYTEFTGFNTQCCPKIRLCGWVKANHVTLVLFLESISILHDRFNLNLVC